MKMFNAQKRKNACKNYLKSFDLFGIPISLKYKGEDTFKTPIGGIVSIISYLSVLAFVLFDLNAVIARESTVKVKSVLKDVTDYNEVYNLTHDNFDLAVYFFN